ncbi:hypothetical protein M404DRAFT_434744 [Pisolithus tinctorius Marx 270]|uniref:Uncharacterized protein n=1 Tax=Pisolithus tinctorius Marx 270 TaxID=870435 RepID=A0A0C3PED2_PISTI|nr:hypothetical protein M404DRAFT_434744 [Pisolithus tinctorius Marx 270]
MEGLPRVLHYCHPYLATYGPTTRAKCGCRHLLYDGKLLELAAGQAETELRKFACVSQAVHTAHCNVPYLTLLFGSLSINRTWLRRKCPGPHAITFTSTAMLHNSSIP